MGRIAVRRKGIVILALLVVLFFVLSLIFTDRWLEKGLEKIGSSVVGARVEIEDLHFSLLGVQMRWDSLQVADPKNTWFNLISTGRCDFDIEALPLLRKKVIIRTIEVGKVRTGTKRSTDGKIDRPVKRDDGKPRFLRQTIGRLEQEVQSAPVWNLASLSRRVNVDSLMELLELSSPGRIDSLRSGYEMKFQGWRDEFQNMDLGAKTAQIDSQLRSIDVQSLKTLPDLQQAAGTLAEVKVRVDSLYDWMSVTRERFESDLKTAAAVSRIDDWVKQDVSRALAMARLPDLSAQNIARFLFSAKVVNQVNRVLGLVDWVRSMAARVPAGAPEKEKPPRLKGQTIPFSRRGDLPGFWLKNLTLSGALPNGLELEGRLSDLASEPRLTATTTRLGFSGVREDRAAVNFNGELDYLNDSPREQFELQFSAMPLQSMRLSDSDLLPSRLGRGSGDLSAALQIGEQNLEGEIFFQGRDLAFDFEGEAEGLEEMVRNIVRRTDEINFRAALVGSAEQTRFGIQSNLDDLFMENIRAAASTEVERARLKISDQVNRRVRPHQQRALEWIGTQESELRALLSDYDDRLQNEIDRLEELRNQVEQRIEREKRAGAERLEQEAKERLKDIF